MPRGRRPGWLALTLLVAAPCCTPVRDFQEAARSLRFSLDRVEPRLQLALPLERSSVTFQVLLGVENPSATTFRILGFSGELELESAGALHPIAHVEQTRPLDLGPGAKAGLAVELTFSYQTLKDHWGPLQAALRGGGGEGEWRLRGQLRTEVLGLPLQVPVQAHRPLSGTGR